MSLKRKVSVSVVLGLVLLIGTAMMCILIRPARDDFYYSTFCDGSIADYFSNTAVHYREVIGRVFVHFILCPLLQLDMWPFRIFNLLLICALGYLCAKLCAADCRASAVGFTAFLSLFWLLGADTLADSVLWGAGSLNYLFPTALVVLYAYLFHKYLIRKSGGGWLVPAAFLSAATVEMTGILTIFVILYFCLANKEHTRRRIAFTGLNSGAAVLGYLSLFTSSGVAARLDQTGFDSVSLPERINANFALFDRMICAPGGIWIIVMLALLSAAPVLFFKAKKVFSILAVLSALAVCLTGLGIIYDGIAVAVIALGAFLLLCLYGVRSYTAGERVIPLCMLCITISLGICMVSPVVGPRMIFPSAVFLIIICLRNLLSMTRKAVSSAVCVMFIPAVLLLSGNIIMFAENAGVVDRNTYLARQCPPDGELVCTYVPNDILVAGTVPSYPNFGGYYLEHMGIPRAKLVCYDETFTPIYYNGQELSRPAVLRNGQYYVPIRTAAEVLGAEVKWELSSAVVITEQDEYYFHCGNYAVNEDHGICRSIKLMDRVRSIDSTVYISQRDFEALFSVQLIIADKSGE